MRAVEPAIWVYVAHLAVCAGAYKAGFGEQYVALSIGGLLLAESARAYVARRGF